MCSAECTAKFPLLRVCHLAVVVRPYTIGSYLKKSMFGNFSVNIVFDLGVTIHSVFLNVKYDQIRGHKVWEHPLDQAHDEIPLNGHIYIMSICSSAFIWITL